MKRLNHLSVRWRWWLLANTQILELILLQHSLLEVLLPLPLLLLGDDVGKVSDLAWLDVPCHWHVLQFGRKHIWLTSTDMPDSWFLLLASSTLKCFHQRGEVLGEPFGQLCQTFG